MGGSRPGLATQQEMVDLLRQLECKEGPRRTTGGGHAMHKGSQSATYTRAHLQSKQGECSRNLVYVSWGSGGRTVCGAVLLSEGCQFVSPDRHVKITTAEVPLSKALNPYHEMCYEQGLAVNKFVELSPFTLGKQRTLLCFASYLDPLFTPGIRQQHQYYTTSSNQQHQYYTSSTSTTAA